MTRLLYAITAIICSLAASLYALGAYQRVHLITHNRSGEGGNLRSIALTISTDGTIVFFDSDATNLIDDDANGVVDVFSNAILADVCHLESMNGQGEQTKGESFWPYGISADGRWVVFTSDAADLVEHDLNGYRDVFIRDRLLEITRLASLNAVGEQGNYGSGPGTTTPDARYASFSSYASNLVDDDTNERQDVFIKDTTTGEVYLVSVASDGTQGDKDSGQGKPSPMSMDGRLIAFESDATNLVPNDTNDKTDVFVHDTQDRTTLRVSLGPSNQQARSDCSLNDISADGRYVTFTTFAHSFEHGFDENVYVYLRDLQKMKTTLISVNNAGKRANKSAGKSSISANGRFVAFHSGASNLDDRATDGTFQIYLRDLQASTTTLVSVNDQGEPGDDTCADPQMSGSGRFIAFRSRASNFTEVETHGVHQVYVRDMGCDWFLRGDSNGDGQVDSTDIDAFVRALIDETQFVLAHMSADWECSNDINRDGRVDFDDIDPFVECMINDGCE